MLITDNDTLNLWLTLKSIAELMFNFKYHLAHTLLFKFANHLITSHMKTIYLLLLFLLSLISCSPAEDKAPQSFTPTSDKGLAIGTITFEDDVPQNDIYRFFYYPQTSDKKNVKKNKGKIQLLGRTKEGRGYSGDFNTQKTYLFVIENEPGNYAFTEYNVLSKIGYAGMVSFSPKFSIPFDIKKGEITYLGELTYIEKAQVGTPKIIVTGRMERDVAEFKKKFPHINWDNTVDRTAKAGDTGAGVVDFR